jgi:hypothetical protein
MKYTRFEDLPCWQRARELCQAVFGLISSGPFSRDFGLKDQNHFEEVIGSLSEMPERGHYPPELERLGMYQYLEIHLKVYRTEVLKGQKQGFMILILPSLCVLAPCFWPFSDT